ncbi:hypothetical protein [Streptomyces sp. NPDC089799]|uniref:hypothetical protein n=1 Tax=Streptomyces sp. NPDC089799 TaxID=3155066 RepID=UPI0034288001
MSEGTPRADAASVLGGKFLGRALGPGDILEFLRRAGLDPDDIPLDDALLIE